MKKLFLTLSCFVAAVLVNAQTPTLVWAKTMGGSLGDNANGIVTDQFGNVYTTGWFYGTADFDPGSGTSNLSSSGDKDIFISKLNSSGNFVWAKRMGSTLADEGFQIALDASGNLYTIGYFTGTVDFNPGTGTFNLTAVGSSDIFISKLDASGNFVWAKSIGTSAEDFALDLVFDASDNLYITGYFTGTADFDPSSTTSYLSSAGGSDIFILKLDNTGNFDWALNLGGTTNDKGRSIALDGTGNIFITGGFSGTVDFNPSTSASFNLTSAGSSDIFVLKLDASGSFGWAKQMGGTDNDAPNSIKVDGEGNVYTTGPFYGKADFDPDATGTYYLTSAGYNDIFISKLDASGNFVWACSMGNVNSDGGAELVIGISGNLYITGWFNNTIDFDPGSPTYNLTSAGAADAFILKLDPSGNFIWAKNMGGIGADLGFAIAVDASGYIYTAGERINYRTVGTGKSKKTTNNGYDIDVAKFSQSSGSEPNTAGVNELVYSSGMFLFPNPAKEQVTINCNLSNAKNGEIKLLDIAGRTIISELFTAQQGENNYTLQLNGVSKGLYYIEFTTEGHERIVKKLMVE